MYKNNNLQIKEKEEKRKHSVDRVVEFNRTQRSGLTSSIINDFKSNIDQRVIQKQRKEHLKKDLEEQMKEKERLNALERVYLDKK